MVTLFIWIIPSMVLHLKWMVYWISIVVIHMFMPKDSNDSTTYLWHCHVSHFGIKRMKKLHVDGSLDSLVLKSLRHANHVYWCIRMKKLHADGSFGLTWFWITWDMQIIPHGQDDWKASFSVKWNKIATCWKQHILMCAVQWVLRHAVNIVMFLLHRWFE